MELPSRSLSQMWQFLAVTVVPPVLAGHPDGLGFAYHLFDLLFSQSIQEVLDSIGNLIQHGRLYFSVVSDNHASVAAGILVGLLQHGTGLG